METETEQGYAQVKTELNIPIVLWEALEAQCAADEQDVIDVFNAIMGPAIHQAILRAVSGPTH